ncbi:hypothetical protein [Streptomyces sp. NBC_00207]|uniref:hypothetical protein n=1 Tax=unclassified Streptomyces TaxID=2593676 RepID=UPI002884BE7A|nr:hypothetical protein [Streptomyces sp. DSM 41633]
MPTTAPVRRYVIVADIGGTGRYGGIITAALYRPPGEKFDVLFVADLDDVPDDTTGKEYGARLARTITALAHDVPLHLYIGVTTAGASLAEEVVVPTLRTLLDQAAAVAETRGDNSNARRLRRKVTAHTYAVDVGPAAAEARYRISLHRRIGGVTARIELGRIKVSGQHRLAPDLRRELASYDPTKRVNEYGEDMWGGSRFEGLLVALTVADHMANTSRIARVFFPRGRVGAGAHYEEVTRATPARLQPPHGAGYVTLTGGISGTAPALRAEASAMASYQPPTGRTVFAVTTDQRFSDAMEDYLDRRGHGSLGGGR